MTTPPGMPAAVAAPIVAPVQNAPTMPTTWSVLTSLSAAGPATDGSQALSPTETTSLPSRMPPLVFSLLFVVCAALTIGPARASIGPVMSPRIPTLTSAASAGVAARMAAAATRPTILFTLIMDVPLQWLPRWRPLKMALFNRRNILCEPWRGSAAGDIAQIIIVSHPDLIGWSKLSRGCVNGAGALRVAAVSARGGPMLRVVFCLLLVLLVGRPAIAQDSVVSLPPPSASAD